MKLSTLQSTLSELRLQPTRSLGQNFLHDQNLASWIVAQLDLQPGDAWVEIGPGLGALTEFALERSSRGVLIEKDDRLISYLRENFPQLQVAHADASRFDLRKLFPLGPVKVLGNLPYYVSSQILFNFTSEPSPVTTLIFTLQKELAERVCATPGNKDYGALTLLLGRRWKTRLVRTLPASVFTPVPQVDSAVVLFEPRAPDELPPGDAARFERLVKLGFSQRRKQLRKMLALEEPRCGERLEALGLSPTARAEELSLAQWLELSRPPAAAPLASLAEGAQDLHGEIFDVVDDQDRVIGTAPRGRVHAERLLHRAIHIFVFNRRGELFLQRRSRWKDVHPLVWDSSAAGHVNSGDDYDVTAARELTEELGVTAPVQRIGAISASANTGWEFVQIYQAHHEGPFCLPPAEIDSGGWFSLAQIERWLAARPQDFAHGFIECWNTVAALRPTWAAAAVAQPS